MEMNHTVERCPNVLSILYDLCVYGKSEKGHQNNLLNLTRVVCKNSLVFNSKSAKSSVQRSYCIGIISVQLA